MNVITRKAERKDFSSIVSLIREFSVFQKCPEKVSITEDQLLIDENIFNAFVAEVDGNIIGFATFFFAYYSWSGKALYLDDLYVMAEYRQQLSFRFARRARNEGAVERNPWRGACLKLPNCLLVYIWSCRLHK
ncbi:MAG: GNAT family N-acetyltransferase [Dyadobacter sp.]